MATSLLSRRSMKGFRMAWSFETTLFRCSAARISWGHSSGTRRVWAGGYSMLLVQTPKIISESLGEYDRIIYQGANILA